MGAVSSQHVYALGILCIHIVNFLVFFESKKLVLICRLVPKTFEHDVDSWLLMGVS